MKTVTIRELHDKTGLWVREAARLGEILVTDRGRTVARIVPQGDPPETPYFARPRLSPALRKLSGRGKFRRDTDSTQIISEDRDDRIS